MGLNRHSDSERQHWDFPPTISPDSRTAAKNFGIIYDLVGFTLVNSKGTHFTARYISHDRKKVYMYDGLMNKGYPLEEHPASFQTHIAGRNIKLPKGVVWLGFLMSIGISLYFLWEIISAFGRLNAFSKPLKLLHHAFLWTSKIISRPFSELDFSTPTWAQGTVDVIAKFCPYLKFCFASC